MKKTIMLFCVLGAIAIYAAAPVKANDQPTAVENATNIPGYGKTVWGMTVEEVLNSDQERIKRLENPAKFPSSTAYASIDNIKIGVADFQVYFLFSNEDQRLLQVNLAGKERSNRGINIRTFSTIEQLLTEKYGSPTFKQENKKVLWRFPKTTIELSHLDIPKINTQVIVSYKPTAAAVQRSKDL